MKTTAKIKIELSQKSLERAEKLIKEFSKEYKKSVHKAIRDATEAMYNKVLEKCHENEIYNHVDAIHWEYDEKSNVGRVWTNDWVLLFNEYGTGVKGSNNPHPNPNGWEYDINEHGEYGWWYPTDSTNPHAKLCKDGVYRAWTKGLESRHMFYDAFQYIQKYLGDKVHVEMQNLSGRFYDD